MISKKSELWSELMKIGTYTGCHQMPERSFFFKGYQFPVCARCTGVIIGYIAATVYVALFLPNFVSGLLCCVIMFIDWCVQYLKIKQSTNIRRLITGIIGGFGIVCCEFRLLFEIIIIFMGD